MSDAGCPVPISKMNPGFFWCRTTIIGVSEEEAAAYLKGELSFERMMDIERAMNAASDALFQAQVPGVQDWMPAKRAMS